MGEAVKRAGCAGRWTVLFAATLLAACATPQHTDVGNDRLPPVAPTTPPSDTTVVAPPTAAPPPATPSAPTPPPTTGRKSGGYYLDDGPGDNPPADLDRIPDAVPRLEPVKLSTTRPYTVMGQTFTPMTKLAPYRARGTASWYGRRYHGKATSSGEIYDMYAMTAAHPTLPIPSYVRVTSLATKRSVVVRVNDRGPFHAGRLIDLSYVAAHRIGVVAGGSGLVEVESIIPGPGTATTNVATAAPGAAAAPSAPVEAGGTGVFLQLGAFGSADTARDFLQKMSVELDGLGEPLHLFERDGLYRVQTGPYANKAVARGEADRIAGRLGLKPFVIVR
ncbi:MAG: septal ring lytic transglycosylase RlpA family protein [Burkholderiales bacterium]|nr:septal ring lytic transglycosylase RlpA family protein [Burkholderiales bacterium]